MNREKLIELTNLCLIYDQDRILVQEKEWNGEKGIIFPGGHVEDNESLLDSVIREVREETGLTIRNPVPCGFKDWFNEDGSRYLVIMYKTCHFTGDLTSSSEGRVFWVTRDEFRKMHVLWNMRELLQIMETDELSELYWARNQDDAQLLG